MEYVRSASKYLCLVAFS